MSSFFDLLKPGTTLLYSFALLVYTCVWGNDQNGDYPAVSVNRKAFIFGTLFTVRSKCTAGLRIYLLNRVRSIRWVRTTCISNKKSLLLLFSYCYSRSVEPSHTDNSRIICVLKLSFNHFILITKNEKSLNKESESRPRSKVYLFFMKNKSKSER